MKYYIFLILSLTTTLCVLAQASGTINLDIEALAQKMDSAMGTKVVASSDETQAAYDSAYISLMHLMIQQHHRTANVLAWQTTSSRIIFFMVLLIVCTGLVFSGIQFYIAAKSKTDMPVSEFELSEKGLKLHSSVLGLLILSISVAFFYLYLQYVYPISFIK